jgi:hypothetical protein
MEFTGSSGADVQYLVVRVHTGDYVFFEVLESLVPVERLRIPKYILEITSGIGPPSTPLCHTSSLFLYVILNLLQ